MPFPGSSGLAVWVGLGVTAIRGRLVRQRLGKIVTEPLHKGEGREVRWLYEYRRRVFYVQFPSRVKVEDLVGVEMMFERLGDEIKMRPKGH